MRNRKKPSMLGRIIKSLAEVAEEEVKKRAEYLGEILPETED